MDPEPDSHTHAQALRGQNELQLRVLAIETELEAHRRALLAEESRKPKHVLAQAHDQNDNDVSEQLLSVAVEDREACLQEMEEDLRDIKGLLKELGEIQHQNQNGDPEKEKRACQLTSEEPNGSRPRPRPRQARHHRCQLNPVWQASLACAALGLVVTLILVLI